TYERIANELTNRIDNIIAAGREGIFDPKKAQAAPANPAVMGTIGSWYHRWRLPKPTAIMKRITATSHQWKRREYFRSRDCGTNKPISAMIARTGVRLDTAVCKAICQYHEKLSIRIPPAPKK